MLTVRAMSVMSHPIPAHLVLMRRRQVLEEKDENFANVTCTDSTQLPRQPKHAPSPREYCRHWAFQWKWRQREEAQDTKPSPLPRMLVRVNATIAKISPAHKIGFENWINLSCLSVKVSLLNSFLLHNLYWKSPREGPKGELRGEQIDCGIREILNYNWNNPKLENFCKRGLNITRKRHQLQLNCSTAERVNSPAQWEKCNAMMIGQKYTWHFQRNNSNFNETSSQPSVSLLKLL